MKLLRAVALVGRDAEMHRPQVKTVTRPTRMAGNEAGRGRDFDDAGDWGRYLGFLGQLVVREAGSPGRRISTSKRRRVTRSLANEPGPANATHRPAGEGEEG